MVIVGAVDDDKKNIPNYFSRFATIKETDDYIYKCQVSQGC